MLTKGLLDQLVEILLPEMGDANARKSLIESALYGSTALQKIQWDGAARPFTVQLLRLLADFGEIASGKPAIVGLLEEVKAQVGPDRQSKIEDLLVKVKASLAETALQNEAADPLVTFHKARIAEWEQKSYALEKRFVNLTLVLDKKDELQRAEDLRFDDLRDVLKQTDENRSRVLLGAPGSGKSTLLRRLQYDHSVDWLASSGNACTEQISFFVQLNGYRANAKGELPAPREWLNARWEALYPQLPPLEEWLQTGRALLLLDALNEMQHKSTDSYFDLIELWREFAQIAVSLGNQLVFTCRRQDYSSALHVPVVEILPMKPEQVHLFLKAYLPTHERRVWEELNRSSELLELYQRPYFLRLLCEQVALTDGEIPRGRAGLFTGFVRKALYEEVRKNSELLRPSPLLTEKDHLLISGGHKYQGDYDLPERGMLIPGLSDLAFKMQEKGAQVRLGETEALGMVTGERAESVLKIGLALNVLDDDGVGIAFFHQLLQEYFAARRLAKEPDPALTHVEWETGKVRPPLSEVIAGLNDFEWLPSLKQTGWEETTLSAVPMAHHHSEFIRELIAHNLPLAARCASAPEIKITEELKSEIQTALLARMRNRNSDLRARIAAGEALGLIGDPRFELRDGKYGKYLMPPLVAIPGGKYIIGDDNGQYPDEKPSGEVQVDDFRIGQFPVTNAEYKLFIEAGGYPQEQWWDTPESLKWLRETEDRQPEYWNDTSFNNPDQPVVGVSWFEARAYCNWLTANSEDEKIYRLPTEAEFEAAARGKQSRQYPYGETFDASLCNTIEGHIGRTTPVGIFDNSTPEGAFDLSGNAWTWTLSIYDQDRFSYPYKSDDGREDVLAKDASRVLRGGSWGSLQDVSRAVYRGNYDPGFRNYDLGFRVVSVFRPPSSS